METKVRAWIYPLMILGVLVLFTNSSIAQQVGPSTNFTADPLPSWNDTKQKKAIITFVKEVTTKGSPNFVPPAGRIATFDNDGTLWSEQPVYFQYYFDLDRIKTLAPLHPEWISKEPFASLLKGDLKSALAGGDKAFMDIFIAAQSGMTTDEYEKAVADWIATARHPQTGRLFTEMVFQPMLELLSYLRTYDFKTYIVSGGEIGFMRHWSEKVYGIPPEQVIGSSIKTRFELRNGTPVIISTPELNFIDDNDGKPIGIQTYIGRRPIASFGNSDGDLQMMQWTSAGSGLRFCLYVHHTDAEREWAYDRESAIGHFDKGLDEAIARGWTVVDMKNDWKIIYPSRTQQCSYPMDSRFFTTVERTVIPVPVPSTSPKLHPDEVSKYSQYGYGVWKFGPGLGYQKRLDLMPVAYTGKSVTTSAKLLHFFAMTDIHISDKETPAQSIYYGTKWGVVSGYSAVMLYTTHVLDAAVQTINSLNKKNKFDFGISLGDDCNSTQYNELRWFIDVLDGKNINPDSGIKDDPIPGPCNDYQDEYKAAGLDKTIPWYQALGNHDHFWMGMFPPDDYIRTTITGNTILNQGNIFADTTGIKSRGFYMGAIEGRTPFGDITGAGPVKDFPDGAPTVPADPNRRSLKRSEWISEFFNTSSNPKGHGFSQSNVTTGFACYTFEPRSGLPVRVIVFDDTQRDDDPSDNYGNGHGSFDQERYNWLVKELDKGQAEGKLMIIAAHIPIGVALGSSGLGSLMTWYSHSAGSDNDLIAKLHTYPNLILWIAGHRHINTVTALKSPDASHPELGFWEVETSSLRDFPQQFRTFEIVRNNDNTISIFITDVDPSVKDGSPAAKSRSYAIASKQIFNYQVDLMPSGSYNAELVKQLTPEMQAKVQNYGTPISK